MTAKTEVLLRRATAEDVPECGRICYSAFSAINAQHNFHSDFPHPDVATGFIAFLFSHPAFYCVVAEKDGQIIGSNCLDERSIIVGVGPVTVDPAGQNAGVGYKLMRAVLDRAAERAAAGVRLVQAAFHNRSLTLYTKLGFDVREHLACLQGRTHSRSVPGCNVRAAGMDDLEPCNQLAVRVHGFERGAELAGAIVQNSALVVERAGRITGYATSMAFFGHGVAETNLDMQALIASVESFGGPGILIPTRNSALFRWCLQQGLHMVQPMTLMSLGLYNDPAASWFPSVTF